MPRYFLALPLPKETRRRLVELQPPACPGMRLVGMDEFHLTLHFLGELRPHEVRSACAALARLRARPFMLALKGVGRFPEEGPPRVLWAGVESNAALKALHATIGATLADAIGFIPEERPYTPHVSVARISDDDAAHKSAALFLEDARDLRIADIAIDRFGLYSSLLVDDVPQYHEAAVFRLA